MNSITCTSRLLSRDPGHRITRSLSNCRPKYYSAVCLQRRPKVVPPFNVIEKTMSQLLAKREIAMSLYSDHELRHFEDVRRAERLASRTEVDEKDVENAAKQTAVDFEDASNRELATIILAPTVTPDDIAGDQKSLNRRLDRHLMLLTKMQLGDRWKWLLPLAENSEHETLRQTAERALSSSLGPQDKLKILFLGNSPSAVHSYRFREKDAGTSVPRGNATARIFFFKASIISGDLESEKIDPKVTADFLWLDRDETAQLLLDQMGTRKYWQSIRSSLFHEKMPDHMVSRIISRVKAGAMKHADEDERKGRRETTAS